jgi:hypothetical protein
MELFREYMLVGGMPQSVITYLKTHDFSECDRTKRAILSLYRKDIARYANGYTAKVQAVFDDIPSQLSRFEKKFTLGQGDGATVPPGEAVAAPRMCHRVGQLPRPPVPPVCQGARPPDNRGQPEAIHRSSVSSRALEPGPQKDALQR